MASTSRRRGGGSPDIWPGFVDVLATLLIIVMFVLMVFVLAQFFLGQALSGRDAALARLRDMVSEYEDLLSIERRANAELRADVAQLSGDLQAANARWESLLGAARASETLEGELADARDLLERRRQEVAALEASGEDLAARLRAALARAAAQARDLEDRDRRIEALEADAAARARTLEDLAARREALAEEVARLEALNARLSSDLADAYTTIEADRETLEARLADLARLEQRIARLTEAREALRAELEAANETVRTDRETLEARLADLVRLRQDLAALEALRDQLEARIADLDSQMAETQGSLAEEQRVSEQARAQVALLSQRLQAVQAELARLADLLDAKEAEAEAQQVQIANLSQRLNAALASKVQELQRYRSEFFGRLREVLGDREGVRVEGDRFVFQSEVLFGVGEAELGPEGRASLENLARTLLEVAREFPDDIDWVLRVDGHTDPRPIRTADFADNWDLSAARAISVVRFLIGQGVPPSRLAAAGFAEYRPEVEGTSEQAHARNRRIELKLDQR
ncbi:peptidoglycan -binding protein [Roseospira visakhapatnamensis]|uniref:Chemotaxis protein MotB n=1 Tax=Roseospira visakhapatnamensis TaxID=390880 RepID=A0A7W6RDS1_9PROT|nr:peptidoglycan -binding protein [Roseospira visakhapatnamensis]MBB4266696.1 chemotaxis protein MotB [Roseospira visakhapatnamensis]